MPFFDDLVSQIAATGQPSGEVWFRGQANSSWPLVPRLLRSDITAGHEKNMFARFRDRATGIDANAPADNDAARWLFLMQHHGVPTRLLDWSESAMTALFFAVSDRPIEDGRLFILVPMELNDWQVGQRVLLAATSTPCNEMMRASFRGEPQQEKIIAIHACASNDRMARQRGNFTVHGSPLDLKDVAPSGSLRSILIPAGSKADLRGALEHLGTSRTTIFHDLDALAIELREQHGIC
jgi:hypothetical protein